MYHKFPLPLLDLIILFSRQRWIIQLLVLSIGLIISLKASTTFLLADSLAYPDSRVKPVWRTELVGGWSGTASPTIADVRQDYPGQEIVVGTKARHQQDINYNYNYPGSIALLSSSGQVLWERTTYTVEQNTYQIGSIWSSAAVADIDNDGVKEIVVGLGGDDIIPDRGGVLAFDPFGNVEWYYAIKDINYPGNGPNNLPDGVRSTPALADVDGNGTVEVMVSGGDNSMHIINGSTGQAVANWPFDVRDTSFSSTAVADIDKDNQLEFAFGADFGYDDPGNCLTTGGILRVMKYDGSYPNGFNTRLDCNPYKALVQGIKVDQAIYSSPVIGDINNDGQFEIVVGSGNYFPGKGYWVKVWTANGTLLKTLDTNGYIDSEPALADLNNDGYLDVIAATEQQATVYVWSGKPSDNWRILWSNTVKQFNGAVGPIFGSPIIADIVPTAAGPEVVVANGAEITILASTGGQLTSQSGTSGSGPTFWLGMSPTAGTPAVADINNDSILEIVAVGSYWDPPNWDPANGSPNWKASVFVWSWPEVQNNATGAALPWPQFRQNAAHLGRVPMPAKLAVQPTLNKHFYNYQSGDSTTISGSFSLLNQGDQTLSYSLTKVSSLPFSFISSTNGAINPLSSVVIDYTLDVASLITGTYPTTVTAVASVDNAPAEGSPQTIIIEADVGTFKKVFLPIIVKGN